jgi:chromosomal replication initiation ATPase DnaA
MHAEAATLEPKQNLTSFERCKALLRRNLGQKIYDAWFGALQLQSVTEGIVTLTVPGTDGNSFLAKHINTNYRAVVLQCAREVWVDIKQVQVISRSMVLKTYTPPKKEVRKAKGKVSLALLQPKRKEKKPLDIKAIKTIVSNFFNMSLVSLERSGPVHQRARDIALYVAEIFLHQSHEDIGIAFGTHGKLVAEVIDQMEKNMRIDPRLKHDVDQLLHMIGE